MSTLRVVPEDSDVSLLAMAISDRGSYGTGEPSGIDLGAVYPQLSVSGQVWFRLNSPDTILRSALNCWWACGRDANERAARKTQAASWYHGFGSLLRERIIARQDAERARS